MSVRTLIKSIQNIMRQDTGVDGDAQRISQLCWMFFLKIIDDQDQELVLMHDDYADHGLRQFLLRHLFILGISGKQQVSMGKRIFEV